MDLELNETKYAETSWLDSRIKIEESIKGGQGLFAAEPIARGEKLIVWGGTLMTEEDIKANRHRPHSAAEIGEGIYLAGRIEDPEMDPDEKLNHSCEPNLWMGNEVTLVAKRDIASGEELTADYAMWVSRPEWRLECYCGSNSCRHVLTGGDWKLKELQEKYKGHFSPYLNKRIEEANK